MLKKYKFLTHNTMANKVGKLAIMLGQCVPSVKANASKIRIRKMELDTNLNMVSTQPVHLETAY